MAIGSFPMPGIARLAARKLLPLIGPALPWSREPPRQPLRVLKQQR